jgi:hypothetical protein
MLSPLAFVALSLSKIYASSVESNDDSFKDFLMAIHRKDNDVVKTSLSKMVTDQRGNSEAIRALFAMEDFHPKASVLIEKAFDIRGLYPKCSALIHRAVSSHQSNTALLIYSEPKCLDHSLPLFPVTPKYGTEKTKALTRPLPLAIVEAAKQSCPETLRMLLEAKKTDENNDLELFLAVNQALLDASQAGHEAVIATLLADDDVEFNQFYTDAVGAATAGNHRRALIKLLASEKIPRSAHVEAALKQLEEEMRTLVLALQHLRVHAAERIAEEKRASQQRAAYQAYCY